MNRRDSFSSAHPPVAHWRVAFLTWWFIWTNRSAYESLPSVETLGLLAPKAAAFISKPGAAPQRSWGPKAAALKARFTSRAGSITHPIEARFQRFFTRRFEFLGRLPQACMRYAPLALKRYKTLGGREFRSTRFIASSLYVILLLIYNHSLRIFV